MKRMIATLCVGVMLFNSVALAASTTAPRVTLTASQKTAENEIVLTVAVKDTVFNTVQFAVDYDENKLTPKRVGGNNPVTDLGTMTTYLAPIYELGEGWMSYEFGTFDTATGIAEYTLYVDPASKGVTGGSDADGYVTAGSGGLNLVSLHFTLKDTAVFTADSIKLVTTASNSDYIILSAKTADPTKPEKLTGRSLGQRDFTALGISLTDTAEPLPPVEPEKPVNPSGGENPNGNTPGGTRPGETTPGGAVKLTDITGNWAEKDIQTLVDKGILTGYGDSTFRPGNKMTRGECCIVLCRTLGLDPINGSTAFSDLNDVWAAPYINAVHHAGLIDGVGGGRFAAGRNITRQEMFQLLAKALALPVAEGQLSQFQDGNTVASWATDAANRMVAAGIVKGSNGLLNPKGEISRAEVASMLCRALENVKIP